MAKNIVKAVTKGDLKAIKDQIDEANLRLVELETEKTEAMDRVKNVRARLRAKKEDIERLEEKLTRKAKEYADE